MLVTQGLGLAGRRLAELAREAAWAGVDVVQVREKALSDRHLRELVAEAVTAVAGTRTRILVNGRADVASVAGAHGVQLPEAGLPVAEVKRRFPGLLVGASRHSAIAAARAEQEGADLVVLGPIFATPGKQERTLGLGPLSVASRMLSVPLYAIGGIDGATAGQAVAAGARGLAAIRAFSSARPFARVVAELREAGP
jgi:thiamine-phosphate pyrophosphorylase